MNIGPNAFRRLVNVSLPVSAKILAAMRNQRGAAFHGLTGNEYCAGPGEPELT